MAPVQLPATPLVPHGMRRFVVSVPEEETSRPLTELISTTPGSSVPTFTAQATADGTIPTAMGEGVLGTKALNVVSAGAPGVLVHVMLNVGAAVVTVVEAVTVPKAAPAPLNVALWLMVFAVPAARPLTVSVMVRPVQAAGVEALMVMVFPVTLTVPQDGAGGATMRVAPVTVTPAPLTATVVMPGAKGVGNEIAKVQLAVVAPVAAQVLVAVGAAGGAGGAAGTVAVATIVFGGGPALSVTVWVSVVAAPVILIVSVMGTLHGPVAQLRVNVMVVAPNPILATVPPPVAGPKTGAPEKVAPTGLLVRATVMALAAGLPVLLTVTVNVQDAVMASTRVQVLAAPVTSASAVRVP